MWMGVFWEAGSMHHCSSAILVWKLQLSEITVTECRDPL